MSCDETFHVLLVEDNSADERLTREALGELRFPTTLHTAVDGEKALAYLRDVESGKEPAPGLILLDTTLPRVSGQEVLAAIAKTERVRKIPIVVLTGSNDPAFIREVYGLKAECYVTKPIDVERHIEVVKIIVSYWAGICARHGSF